MTMVSPIEIFLLFRYGKLDVNQFSVHDSQVKIPCILGRNPC